MTRATQPPKGTSDWMSARHPTARKSRRLETITSTITKKHMGLYNGPRTQPFPRDDRNELETP
jgi:hypothetical protein